MITIVGIDPGISGAVVRIREGKIIGARRDFKNFQDVITAINQVVQAGDRVFLENVHARPGEGVCSVFTFGKAAGIALGVATVMAGTPPVEVAPLKWQNHFRWYYNLPKVPGGVPFKELTRSVAERVFPEHKELFKRKKDHGTADAALIAKWGEAQLSAELRAKVAAKTTVDHA